MKALRFFVLLSLTVGMIAVSSCEKWDNTYRCGINEVPGTLFPGSLKENLIFTEEGQLTLTNRLALMTGKPIDMTQTTVLNGTIGPRRAVTASDASVSKPDAYGMLADFEGIKYSIKDGKLHFPTKTFPVKVTFYQLAGTKEETRELQGKMRIDGTMELDGDRFDLAHYTRENCDITISLTLENGQRLRFRFNSLEDPCFRIDPVLSQH